MSNKVKYLEEAMSSDISIAIKYVDKLERMMKTYLNKEFVLAISDLQNGYLLLKQDMGEEYVKNHITLSEVIQKVEGDVVLYSFEQDDNFLQIDSGALIATDDQNIANAIKNQLKTNPDFTLSPVLAAIAVATIEDNGML